MRLLRLLLLVLLPWSPAQAQAIFNAAAIHQPVAAKKGMVVAQEAVAAGIGADILRQGGNAVDAAVAVGFALAVTLPRAGNLGGGGFMLVHLAAEHQTIAIDYRELAPHAATADMFLDQNGRVDPQKARFSHLSAGVPGTVAGLLHALDRYGSMTRKQVMAPAIKLAEQGFIVSYPLAESLRQAAPRLARSAAAASVFLHQDGSPYQPGETLVQADLGWSLRQISAHGRDGFYRGKLADRLVADMTAMGGLIDHDDLARYQAVERAPVIGSYRGYRIVTMPPPSSGGVHLIEILNTIEGDDIAAMGQGSAQSIHLMAEAMKQAFADRSKYLGDPDFVNVPVAALTDKAYARAIRARIDSNHARPSSQIGPALNLPYESNETTHFSVMDAAGNAVANTYTLNFSYGSSRMAAATGILLNNEMDDFSAKAGTPNAFGLLGGDANAIAGGKRPLSSMTPVIVMRGDAPYLVTGSPGGSTIITIVAEMLVNILDHRLNIAEATARPRFHHQWHPDHLLVEPGFSPDTLGILRALGHGLKDTGTMGATATILHDQGIFHGAADPRRAEAAAVGVE